jgi:hypothetical protein
MGHAYNQTHLLNEKSLGVSHGGEEGVAREHSVESLGKYLTDRGVIDDAKAQE